MTRDQFIPLGLFATGTAILVCAAWLWLRPVVRGSVAPFETTMHPSQRVSPPATAGHTVSLLEQIEILNSRLDQDSIASPADVREARALLARWARTDPRAALSYALSPLTTEDVGIAFLHAADAALIPWGRADPEAARDFVQQHVTSPRAVAILAPAMMATYGAEHPEAAVHWVKDGFDTDSDELRPALARELVLVLERHGHRADIEAWLSAPSVAQSLHAVPAMKTFAYILAGESPQKAMEFSKKLPRGTHTRGIVLREAVRQWASQDLAEVHDWLMRTASAIDARPESPGQEHATPALAGTAYTAAELDYAIAGCLLSLSETAPAVARESLDAIKDRSLRERLARHLQ